MLPRTLLAGACALNAAAALVPPSQDPWYTQPANISAYAPGELIRARQVAPELETYVPLGTSMDVEMMHQYLYRTTDSVGAPVAAAATLIVPRDADPTKLLAYETFYDANNPDCSPSYTLRHGSATAGGGLLPHMTQPMDLAFVRPYTPTPHHAHANHRPHIYSWRQPSNKAGGSSRPTTKASTRSSPPASSPATRLSTPSVSRSPKPPDWASRRPRATPCGDTQAARWRRNGRRSCSPPTRRSCASRAPPSADSSPT